MSKTCTISLPNSDTYYVYNNILNYQVDTSNKFLFLFDSSSKDATPVVIINTQYILSFEVNDSPTQEGNVIHLKKDIKNDD